MDETKKVYCSYLLRIWVEPGDGDQWRFSLEDTRTGNRKGFASFIKMVTYLAELTVDQEKRSSEQHLLENENPTEEEM